MTVINRQESEMKMTKFERKENSLLKQLQSPMCPAQINLIQFSGGREVG